MCHTPWQRPHTPVSTSNVSNSIRYLRSYGSTLLSLTPVELRVGRLVRCCDAAEASGRLSPRRQHSRDESAPVQTERHRGCRCSAADGRAAPRAHAAGTS